VFRRLDEAEAWLAHPSIASRRREAGD
jgi:uncharacterized protein (DUF1810 family)